PLSDEMSTVPLPLRVRGSTIPLPFSGIGLFSCGMRNEPLIAILKAPPLDVVETASETSLVETVEPPPPQAPSITHAARAANKATSRLGVRPRIGALSQQLRRAGYICVLECGTLRLHLRLDVV